MKYLIITLFLLSVVSCTQNIEVVKTKNSTPISTQRALAEMAKTWTQEERDNFKKDFFYSESEVTNQDSLLKK
jgi:hypothetical protein